MWLGIWQSSCWGQWSTVCFNFLGVKSYPEEQHPPPPLWTWGSSSMICTPRLAAPGWLEPLPFALSSTCAVSIIPKRGRKQKLFRTTIFEFSLSAISVYHHDSHFWLYTNQCNKHSVSWLNSFSCKFKKIIASLFVQMYNGHNHINREKFLPWTNDCI